MYQIGDIPQELEANPAVIYLRQELVKIQQEMAAPKTTVNFSTSYKPPEKPREGDDVKADGTTWNPGSGAGRYNYRSGSWRFLG